MAQFEATTRDGRLVVLGKTLDNQLAVDGEPVSSVINTPLGVLLLCGERGYTIEHPLYYRLLALEPPAP